MQQEAGWEFALSSGFCPRGRFSMSVGCALRPASTSTNEPRCLEIHHQHGRAHADHSHGAMLVMTHLLTNHKRSLSIDSPHFLYRNYWLLFIIIENPIAVAATSLLIINRTASKSTTITGCYLLKKVVACTSTFTKYGHGTWHSFL